MTYRILGNRLDAIIAVSARVFAIIGLITLAAIIIAGVHDSARAEPCFTERDIDHVTLRGEIVQHVTAIITIAIAIAAIDTMNAVNIMDTIDMMNTIATMETDAASSVMGTFEDCPVNSGAISKC